MKYLIVLIVTTLTFWGLHIYAIDILKIINPKTYLKYQNNKRPVTILILIICIIAALLFVITDEISSRKFLDDSVEKVNKASEDQINNMKNEIVDYIDSINDPKIDGLQWSVNEIMQTDDIEVMTILNKIISYYDNFKYEMAYEEIQYGLALTMEPKDKILFLNICGSVSNINRKYERAEELFLIMNTVIVKELNRENGYDQSFLRLAQVTVYNNLGIVYSAQNELELAVSYYAAALTINQIVENLEGQATQYTNIGTLLYNTESYLKAIEYHEESLLIYQELGILRGQATALGNIGACYYGIKDYENALKYYHSALSINKNIGESYGTALNYFRIGSVYKNEGDLESAETFLLQALDYYEFMGLSVEQAETLKLLGFNYKEMGKHEKALNFFISAQEFFKELDDKESQSNILFNIASIYQDKGIDNEAIDKYKEALIIRETISDYQGQVHCLFQIGQIYSKNGENEKAIKIYQDFLSIYNLHELDHGDEIILLIEKEIEKIKNIVSS